MFTQVTLKNFKTHKLTTIELHPVTLLIGNNNSGKSNLLAGIQHFCSLVRRGRPGNANAKKTVNVHRDLYAHRYRLADGEPMEFKIAWNNSKGSIIYEIELHENKNFPESASCKEKITIKLDNNDEKIIVSGYDQPTNLIALRQNIEDNTSLQAAEKKLCRDFFGDFANTYSYHFQPAFLKGLVKDDQIHDIDDAQDERDKSDFIKIPSELGSTGRGLQAVIKYIKEKEERTFTRFTALMRRFDHNFQGVRYNDKISKLVWNFDLGQNTIVQEFPPDAVSDGFMKAAAISLLASLYRTPSLILLEEIENGVNPGNIQELMRWIWQMTSPTSEGFTSQFIITSHSPSVLREFHNHLDHVYTVRLEKRNRKSDVRNLNTSLDTLVGIGTVEGEIIEDETTGKKIVEIPKYKLAELWYEGTIG
ncbi:MAG: AAA family ATPase [Sphaerospermopsis kisseleviana]|jgi:AAA15 family ATPase/GTPase|uniref:AAA family ATPase n=1 Tax=Sphaerospermopsis kisseleviana CS-549 TaxID=3021783 RepID=A0ABT4ZX04_9CYAN|nr:MULTISPECIES: ATP-binding protein [Sphaerospermopsis]MBD2135407.1 AAA family ATPase [Sphaerospermopsis sp. FACHB-1094]MDB9443935.1 AAA family ATPase [Sphaerospermopsis kisseleviana CS-549]BAZ80018.1 ATPase-like protein [Sphaerospermopsis kisseleviana NIES-73]